MIAAFLYLNAALYGVFASWCTLQWKSTSGNLGYRTLDNSGKSEYLVIYGGLQWGLTASFLLFARDDALHAAGILFALAVYVPIVAYRLVTIWRFRPVSALTRMVGGLEVVLLLMALTLYFTAPRT